MGKAMIARHALQVFADRYRDWKYSFPYDSEEGREIMVPIKHLRIAFEIIDENKKEEK